MRKSILKSRSACSSLTAALMLAMAFNFSCSEDKDKDERFDYCITTDGCLEGPFTASTCKGQLSNDCPGSSSSNACKPVTIGTQVWQKCNLNVAVNAAVNIADKQSKCYNDDSTYCEVYGGLYDWATAMDLPSGCNLSDCGLQVKAMHQGICPSGWHIPSVKEWRELEKSVGGESIAGKKLKANSTLWRNNGMGTDDYGFSALPGGEYGYPTGIYYSFEYIGFSGSFWTATEYSEIAANVFELYHNSESSLIHDARKENFYSVRCLKN